MKFRVGVLAAAALAAAAITQPSTAQAQRFGHFGGGWHGGGWHGGWRAPVVFVGPRFFVGSSLYYPGPYYPGPYAYAPPVAVAAPAPPVYTQSSQYWYYCQNPAGYYPSVPQCPTQWLQVAPQQQ